MPNKKPTITREEALQKASIGLKDFAALFGIAEITAYRQASRGEIETFQIGSRKMVPYNYYSRFMTTGGDA